MANQYIIENSVIQTCNWPDCKCSVPDYAWSWHNRKNYCEGQKTCLKGMAKDTCPYNPRLGCDCGANPPRRVNAEFISTVDLTRRPIPDSAYFITDPHHGGKISCYKCSGFFKAGVDVEIKIHGVSFHEGCYNSYYGLDKPID